MNAEERLLWLLFLLSLATFHLTNSSVLPAYIWPLEYIYNQTVPVTPPMVVHGGVSQVTNHGLKFDGKSGWIDAGDFTGNFIRECYPVSKEYS